MACACWRVGVGTKHLSLARSSRGQSDSRSLSHSYSLIATQGTGAPTGWQARGALHQCPSIPRRVPQVIEKRKVMEKLKGAGGADPDADQAVLRKQLRTAENGSPRSATRKATTKRS